MSFGYRYDCDRRAVVEASPFPSILVSLRNKVAAIFDRPAEAFDQVLINEYRPGAGIGWHSDKTQFDEVVGALLLAPCVLRFCPKAAETWDRVSLAVEPCSAYLLSGAARTVWSTAFPRSISFVIQSPCGRSLRRRFLARCARNGSALQLPASSRKKPQGQ